MNLCLLILVIIYLLGTLAIGAWAGSRIKDTSDFAVAGHSLPLYMVITTSFATWFGAETVMGIPAKFVQGGLREVVEDPFGSVDVLGPRRTLLCAVALQNELADHR